ncbi:MAG TPA: DUF3641 domain-containing protein [Chthoniobacteraceae bacterium]|nr:DUF3641 domain-containing protein [Chthoniobacteraceae bacterium]
MPDEPRHQNRRPTQSALAVNRFDRLWDKYLETLANSFNPGTLENVMCRSTLSVGWRGELYDCDFNQMLGMQLRNGKPLYLWDVTPEDLAGRSILTGVHCLACTAGCGSSCNGAVT